MESVTKIYILSDLEGVAGVSKFEHCNPSGRFYSRSRRLLTKEVNAAVEGAFSGGASEIVVWDGHGVGGLDPDILHSDAKLISGAGNLDRIGLDESYDGMFVVGQHTMNHTPRANLCHTYDSRRISRMRLNGGEIGELGMRTVLAGELCVPLAFVAGGDKACEEAEDLVGEIETVSVKRGLSREDALSLSPKKARDKIRRGAESAMDRLEEFEPYTIQGPYTLEIEYFEVDPENPDSRDLGRPIERVETEKSDDFSDIAR